MNHPEPRGYDPYNSAELLSAGDWMALRGWGRVRYVSRAEMECLYSGNFQEAITRPANEQIQRECDAAFMRSARNMGIQRGEWQEPQIQGH